MVKNLTVFITFMAAHTGCIEGPGLFDQAKSSADQVVATTEADGAVTGAISAGSNLTQLLMAAANSAISGSTVAFPPGSLSIDSSVTLEESSDIANSSTATDLGLSAGELSSASSAVVVDSSISQDADSPFTLQIPVGSGLAGFGLAESRLIVVYKVYIASEGNKLVAGILPPSKVTVVDGKASFQTKHFGAFQLAYTTANITTEIRKDSNNPILSKRAEKKLPALVWNHITGKLLSGERAIEVHANLTGGEIEHCFLEVDDNKAVPFLRVQQLSNTALHKVFATSDKEQSLYGRFVCKMKDARVVNSGWSSEAKVKELTAVINDLGGSYQVGGAGVKKYSFATASTVAGCTGAESSHFDVSTPITTANTTGFLCVRGIDAGGNKQTPGTVLNLSQSTAGTAAANVLTIDGDLAMDRQIYSGSVNNLDDRFFHTSDANQTVLLEGNCPVAGGAVKIAGDIIGVNGAPLPVIATCGADHRYSQQIKYGAADLTYPGFGTDSMGRKVTVHQNGSTVSTYFVYTGLSGAVHKVSNLSELNVAAGASNAIILMTASINATGMTALGAGWSGLFLGQGYTISDFTRNDAGTYRGFIDSLGPNGSISHVVLDNITVGASGTTAAGAAVGFLSNVSARVREVTVKNSTVVADFKAGGIVGHTVGNIELIRCHVETSSITATGDATSVAGGIAGYAYQMNIKFASAKSNTISSTGYAGGLVGEMRGGGGPTYEIINSYVHQSTGAVSGSYVAALVGKVNLVGNINIKKSYAGAAPGSISGATVGSTHGQKLGGGTFTGPNVYTYVNDCSNSECTYASTSKTFPQMKQQASFVGFDFINTWKIDENNDFPKFVWQ